jgi:hypothetical protein
VATYHQPVHALVHAPTVYRRAGDDAPISVLQLAQTQRLAYLSGTLRARLILLVREDQQRGIPELFLVQHRRQFFRGRGQTVDVGRVNDEDDGRRVGVVAAPVGADRRLPAEILPPMLAGERGAGPSRWRTQTLKLRFLYVTDSTLKPIVGIVVTTSPICLNH